MNAFLVNGKTRTAVNAKLADVLAIAFDPSSAAANVAGVNRAEVATLLAKNLPALGKFDSIVLDTDKQIVTVKNEDLTKVLDGIVSACRKNEAYRASVASENTLYDSVRTATQKNPAEGKRGRKSESIESKYADAFNLTA